MEVFLGTIMQVAFPFAPSGWAFCNGQLLPIQRYSALFALLGTQYGGDGVHTFGLPDLRGGDHPANATGQTQAAVSVMQPYTGINYVIALEGIFSSRS